MNTFQTREITITDSGRKLHLTVEFGMRYLQGNASPYFAITGETRRFWRGKPYSLESCGCLHDIIAKKLPSLRPLLKWHLADQDGLPMHYKADALYWRDCLLSDKKSPYEADPIATFASHVCYGTVAGDEEMGVEERMRSESLGEWLDSRAAALRAAFLADMAAHGVKLLVRCGDEWKSQE